MESRSYFYSSSNLCLDGQRGPLGSPFSEGICLLVSPLRSWVLNMQLPTCRRLLTDRPTAVLIEKPRTDWTTTSSTMCGRLVSFQVGTVCGAFSQHGNTYNVSSTHQGCSNDACSKVEHLQPPLWWVVCLKIREPTRRRTVQFRKVKKNLFIYSPHCRTWFILNCISPPTLSCSSSPALFTTPQSEWDLGQCAKKQYEYEKYYPYDRGRWSNAVRGLWIVLNW